MRTNMRWKLLRTLIGTDDRWTSIALAWLVMLHSLAMSSKLVPIKEMSIWNSFLSMSFHVGNKIRTKNVSVSWIVPLFIVWQQIIKNRVTLSVCDILHEIISLKTFHKSLFFLSIFHEWTKNVSFHSYIDLDWIVGFMEFQWIYFEL